MGGELWGWGGDAALFGSLLSQTFLAFDLALNLSLTRLEEDWKPTGSRPPQAG
jgi:hypothetical protein